MPHRPCAAVVIVRPDETILLVHKPRDRDAWQIPQGGIESGESVREAASRELREETGIVITPDDFAETGIHYRYDYPSDFVEREQPKYEGQQLTFVIAAVSSDIVVTVDRRELDDFAWVDTGALATYLEREEYRDSVTKALQTAL